MKHWNLFYEFVGSIYIALSVFSTLSQAVKFVLMVIGIMILFEVFKKYELL